jgi:hypothetical protein
MIIGAKVTGALCPSLPCAADPCANPQFVMTPAGGWPSGLEMDQYFAVDVGAGAAPAAIALCLDEQDLTAEPFEIDEIDVDEVVDPTRLWAGDYAFYEQRLFGTKQGGLAMGTDYNGLSPQFPFSDYRPSYAVSGAECGDTTSDGGADYGDDASGGTLTLQRPLAIGGKHLCFPERGLASYGMLPEFFAAVYHHNPAAYRSLFQSAAATIAAWRGARAAAMAYATSPLTCAAASPGATEAGP